ncbi:MAG: hypothetical protein ABIH23_10805, partial [bacterium]
MRATSWVLKCACLMAGCFSLLSLGMFMHEARKLAIESQQVVSRTQDVLEQVRLAAVGIREYSDEQVARLRDPKNQKALDATIQAGA